MNPLNNFQLTILLGFVTGYVLTLSQHPWDPHPKSEEWWLDRHNFILNTTRARAKEIKIVFIGSSSVEYWGTTAKDLWDSKYAPLGAVNYGIRGDRTQHLLWRIENGELDGLSPKLVVIYIGSNNAPRNKKEDTVRGVNQVVDKIHDKLPNSNLLFCAFFPRGDRSPARKMLTKIRNISETLRPMIDGDETRRTHFLDIFSSFAPDSLEEIHQQYYQDDLLHLNRDGYSIWDSKMNTTFYDLIK